MNNYLFLKPIIVLLANQILSNPESFKECDLHNLFYFVKNVIKNFETFNIDNDFLSCLHYLKKSIEDTINRNNMLSFVNDEYVKNKIQQINKIKPDLEDRRTYRDLQEL